METNANAMMNGTNPSNMTTMLSLLKAADIHRISCILSDFGFYITIFTQA